MLGLMSVKKSVKPQFYQWGMFGLLCWCLAFPIVVGAQIDRVFGSFDLSKTASYPGGTGELYKKIRSEIYYPEATLKAGRGGVAYVSFVVEHDGSVSNVRILHAPDTLCARMLHDFVALHLSRWFPAEANGHSVRQHVLYYVYFHPHAGQVRWVGEGNLDDYEAFVQIPPECYGEFYIPLKPHPIAPGSVKLIIPEAARAAGINALVFVESVVGPDGVLQSVRALNDPGYGCANAAETYLRGRKYWVPQCFYDTCFTYTSVDRVVFCTDTAAAEAATRIYEEAEMLAPGQRPERYFDGLPIKWWSKKLNGTCKADFVVEKDGTVSQLQLELLEGDSLFLVAARDLVDFGRKQYRLDNYPCRTHQIRYIQVRKETLSITPINPVELPPPDGRRVYLASETDTPATYRYGAYGLRQLPRSIWRYPGLFQQPNKPRGEVIVEVEVTKNGSLYTKLKSGIAPGWDEAAQSILNDQSFLFTPARVNGYPVNSVLEVRMRWE